MTFKITGSYKVCLSDVNSELGSKTCQSFGERYDASNVHFVVCDVTSTASVSKLWSEAVSHFNVKNVDLWVNNAGVMGK